MWLALVVITIYCSSIVIDNCNGINLIHVTDGERDVEISTVISDFNASYSMETFDNIDSSHTIDQKRRYLIVSPKPVYRQEVIEDDKDASLKRKIAALVQQSIQDAKVKMQTIDTLKEKHRDDSSYKVGFIFSSLKKSKDVMSELFNVAVKHRQDWKALEQLKVFELIVHTNVDTTNLVRQLVEIHIQNVNTTLRANLRKRIVLI